MSNNRRIDELRTDLKSEIRDLRAEMNSAIRGLRAEMKERFSKLEERFEHPIARP